jgi:hypothetical protein
VVILEAHLVDIGIPIEVAGEIAVAGAGAEEGKERGYLVVALELVLAELLHAAFEVGGSLDQRPRDLGVGLEGSGGFGLGMGVKGAEGQGLEIGEVAEVELTYRVELLEAGVERG